MAPEDMEISLFAVSDHRYKFNMMSMCTCIQFTDVDGRLATAPWRDLHFIFCKYMLLKASPYRDCFVAGIA